MKKLSKPADPRDSVPDGYTRFVCTVAYDGTNFFGWQSQPGGNTIQDFLEKRLAEIFRRPVRVHVSGRTDSGVHANAQVFHFDEIWAHDLGKLLLAMRSYLPAGILIKNIRTVRAGFHARYSACGKRYVYRIYEGFAPPQAERYVLGTGIQKLNTDAMRVAAGKLLGVHNFWAFGANHGQSPEKENPVKDLRRLDVVRRGKNITITTEASGYLYKMVRRLVGGLIKVGSGKMTPDELVAYRDARTISAVVPTAPARGLTMEKVFYAFPANANATNLSGGEE